MPRRPRGRTWGYWTEAKLDLLAAYLHAFAVASSQRARGETVYLDLFAGVGENINRATGELFDSSPIIALKTDPALAHLRFGELPSKASALRADLVSAFPGRDIDVVPGDCNESIGSMLAGILQWRWAPTFAFIDPDGLELAWSTLEQLAAHKSGERYKVELWMLFTAAGVQRTLYLDRPLTQKDGDRTTRLFGTEMWRVIHELRRAGEIDGAHARWEYVNLMRWLLEERLGYRHTHALELFATRGQPLYHMVFATDNAAGNKIMGDLYRKAFELFPAMQAHAAEQERDLRRGTPRLFDPGPPNIHVEPYRHERPLPPLGMENVDPEDDA